MADEGDKPSSDECCVELWLCIHTQSMFVEILSFQESREMTKTEASEKANC